MRKTFHGLQVSIYPIIKIKYWCWTESQTSIISGTQIRMVGKPYHTFYLREFGGINPDDGTTWFYTNTLDETGIMLR